MSYAVEPFAISRDQRTLEVDLTVPEQVRPGAALPITHKASRPGRIAVYAVDEGILQVAAYQMPDPLGFSCARWRCRWTRIRWWI